MLDTHITQLAVHHLPDCIVTLDHFLAFREGVVELAEGKGGRDLRGTVVTINDACKVDSQLELKLIKNPYLEHNSLR